MKKLIIFISTAVLFLTVHVPIHADNRQYIESFPDSIQIIQTIGIRQFDFCIDPPNKNNTDTDYLDYCANTPLIMSTSIFYKSFGISAGFDIDSSTEDEDKYGRTDYIDIQVYHYTNTFSFELFYQNYKGYYLDKPEKYGLSRGAPDALFPQLKTRNIGLNVIYTFSDTFTLNTAMHQTQRQLKTDWSFLLMASLNHFSIDSDTSLVPVSEHNEFPNNTQYNGGEYTSLGVSPGISVIIPIMSFYLSGTFFCGPGIMYKRYDTDDDKIRRVSDCLQVNIKMSCGYNGKYFMAGMTVSVDSHSTTAGIITDEVDIQTFSGYVDLYAGVRF